MLKEGEELAEGAVVEAVQGHLRLDVAIRAGGRRFVLEVMPDGAAVPAASRGHGLQVGWRGEEEAEASLGHRLCEALIERLGQAPTAWTAMGQPREEPENSASKRLRSVRGGRILHSMGQGEQAFWALEPYVGCLVGCRFCYAQARLQPWREALQLPDAPWGSWSDARSDAAEALAQDLAELPPRPIKFTPIRADPYHALETSALRTKACLEVLAQKPPPATIVLTRCALARRDLPLLATIEGAMLGFSMPTMDDRVRRHFEPRAASTHERFAILREASALGIATFAVVQPMLPGPLERLADLLAAHVDSVSLDVLHGEHGAAGDFATDGFQNAVDPGWQRDRLEELAELLRDRGVPLWSGELPPTARKPPRARGN